MPLYPRQWMSSPRFVVWENKEHLAYLHPNPCTPGVTVLQQKPRPGEGDPLSLFQLPLRGYTELLLGARAVAGLLCQRIPVTRCALISEPEPPTRLKLVPLHGFGPDWEPPSLSGDLEFNAEYPGYCCSKKGPRAADSELDRVQSRVRAQLESRAVSYRFLGEPGDPRLFARIVRGAEERQWRVWVDIYTYLCAYLLEWSRTRCVHSSLYNVTLRFYMQYRKRFVVFF
ncbi:UNVERIFIED_CONTAM: hypothetical protein FKN15_067886 [Acipenser sinensis]